MDIIIHATSELWTYKLINTGGKNGVTAQQLRALDTLTEDLGSVPTTQRVAHNHLDLQFQSIWHPLLTSVNIGMHVVHIGTGGQNNPTHKYNK